MGHVKLKSSQIFIVAAFFMLLMIMTVLCIGLMVKYEVITDVSKIETVSYWKAHLPEEQTIWYDNGIEELQYALNMIPPEDNVRNVIIFVANGFSPESLATVRFQNSAIENKNMIWDKFPYMARLKNSCSEANFCDASTVSTALFGGVKTNYGVAGVDSAVPFRNCTAAQNTTHHVSSILHHAQILGMRTGLITTGRLTAPFVASLYAHTADSSWECDSSIPEGYKHDCIDIAKQLISSDTGKNLNIIMGGGRQTLVTKTTITNEDPIDEQACRANGNGRNLLRDWLDTQLVEKRTFAVAHNEQELVKINGSHVDYLLGVFGNGHISSQKSGIDKMVDKSLEILQRKNSGFMLFVNNFIQSTESHEVQIQKLLNLNEVVANTMNLTDNIKDETLILMVFTSGEYRKSTLNITEETDVVSTLEDLIKTDTLPYSIPDTIVYATGPKSYLFHGVRDETFLSYALAYLTAKGQEKKSVRS